MPFSALAAGLLGFSALVQGANVTAPSQVPDPAHYVQPFPMAACHGHRLEDAGVAQIQTWYDSGKLTVSQVVSCYLDRIAQIDPYVNAVMELNPDALDIADALDKELAAGKKRGPMHGIVVLVKDNFATADKMQTTAGSLALVGSVVPRDAHVVHLLRQAGAVILGHAGMSEWADMRSTDYSEGYSARGGQVRNSYNLTQEPGGSSSGSGHSVTTNMVTVAFGTETDGSVISPAERANIVGIKPTVGLTSRAGIIPESGHQDTVGTFGRSVEDAAYALDAIFGFDYRDEATLAQLGKTPKNYVQFVSNKTALKGTKVGIPWERLWQGKTTSLQIPALLEAVEILKQNGVQVYNNTNYKYVEEIVSPDGWNWAFGPANQSEITVVNVDFYNNLAAYLSELGNTTIRSLEDLVAFNDAPQNLASEGGEPDTAAAFASGQDGLLASLATKGIQNSTYQQALTWCQRTSRAEGIDFALNPILADGTQVHLDALLIPSDDNGAGTNIPAQAGYPIITVPVGIDDWHTPFGLSFVGTAFSEPILIKLASAAQDAFGPGRRVKPTFFEYNATNIPVNWAIGTYL
ncbi:amidase signature domain-containing protein [Roridomyces roridus]|uniref:Amidase signature domain-containing protein n=1 Tax=Roridomyces roridus TaxID=1738132 RepID=A0AAD7CK08_9AGAR|nr:amidase signature domain-containing protein [Roridomyces roridus]